MSLSSVVVEIHKNSNEDRIKKDILKFKECEIALIKDFKIIVLIETIDVDAQILIFKELEKIDGVKNVYLSYFYDDSDASLNDCFINDMLNNDKIDAKNIIYNGNVNYKI